MGVYKPKGSKNWWYEFRFGGKRVRQSTKQTNRRVAEQIEAAHRTRLAKGEVGIIERTPAPTIQDFEPRFIAAIKTQKGEKAAKWYGGTLKSLLEYKPLAAATLDEIDEAMIDAFAETRLNQRTKHKKVERYLRPASVNRELATLRRMLRLAFGWQIIPRVPRIRMLAGERQREFILRRSAEKVYLAACPQPLADVATVLVDTGLRLGEAVSLEWPQVRLDPPKGSHCGVITVLGEKAKSGRTRHIPLTERATEVLQSWGPKTEGPVFHRDGARLLESTLSHQHKRVRELLRLSDQFVLHSLRHTYGTRLGESGTADAFTIMRLMGHASITTSQRYVHPTPETLERAVRRMESGRNEGRTPPDFPIAEVEDSARKG